MDMFNCLLVGHLVGDFLFQNRWMAENKTENWLALVVHSFVYSLTIYLFSLIAGGLDVILILMVFIAHLILDQRSLLQWWTKNVTKSSDVLWLQIITDQTFHILILFLVSLL